MIPYDAETIIIRYGRSNIVSVEPGKAPGRAKEIKEGTPCEKNCNLRVQIEGRRSTDPV